MHTKFISQGSLANQCARLKLKLCCVNRIKPSYRSAGLQSCMIARVRARGSCFPMNGSVFCPCSIGNEIQPAAGRNPTPQVEILTSFGRNLRALPADGKARRTFVLRALFTLAAIYSRGTCRPTTIDVLMFHFRVRNGTGWGHQAMTTRLRLALFCSSVCLIIICACGLLFVFQRQAGIRVACFVCFCSSLTLGYICYQAEIACHRGGV